MTSSWIQNSTHSRWFFHSQFCFRLQKTAAPNRRTWTTPWWSWIRQTLVMMWRIHVTLDTRSQTMTSWNLHDANLTYSGQMWGILVVEVIGCDVEGRSLTHCPPGRCSSNCKIVIPEHILRIKFMSISCEIAAMRIPQSTFDDKARLVQVMAWCRQAARNCLSQC